PTPHRHPPPSPTRRSSDLARDRPPVVDAAAAALADRGFAGGDGRRRPVRPPRPDGGPSRGGDGPGRRGPAPAGPAPGVLPTPSYRAGTALPRAAARKGAGAEADVPKG